MDRFRPAGLQQLSRQVLDGGNAHMIFIASRVQLIVQPLELPEVPVHLLVKGPGQDHHARLIEGGSKMHHERGRANNKIRQ